MDAGRVRQHEKTTTTPDCGTTRMLVSVQTREGTHTIVRPRREELAVANRPTVQCRLRATKTHTVGEWVSE